MAGSRIRRLWTVASLGAGGCGVGTALAYWWTRRGGAEPALASWTSNYTPSVHWDFNWDHRDPKSIVKPSKGTAEDDNRYNSEIETYKSTSVRHLFLIRHGQYHLDGKTDKERILTTLGREQAELTGARLKELGYKWDRMERSTMTRAQETAKLIAQYLDPELKFRDCSLLEEGAPVPPEPPIGRWKPEPYQFFQDGARIEAAFRKHFHRAKPSQTDDTFTLVVCHANVIRYFVCRAMQFPPEAWLRISLSHASITWLSILPNGRVILRSLSDTGHMEPRCITSQ
ncbi:serine/threonine-protein phosphatase Pgam5, mitochondrial-like [Arctopsyche grandis]|uniref:serine/threonine-protein phosphatase Pgam5, mitochondrial-like n=1 Tax=Arctopsyche grandis TaxID=121162 RepID=UPI00406D8301